MKKLLFLFAVLLQSVLVMAQNPAKQQLPQQKPCSINNFNPFKSSLTPEQRRQIITEENGSLPQGRVPSMPGPKDPVKPIFYQYK